MQSHPRGPERIRAAARTSLPVRRRRLLQDLHHRAGTDPVRLNGGSTG